MLKHTINVQDRRRVRMVRKQKIYLKIIPFPCCLTASSKLFCASCGSCGSYVPPRMIRGIFLVKITLLTIRIALIRRMIPFLKGKQFHIDISSLNTATWNVIGNLKSTLYDDIKRKKKK